MLLYNIELISRSSQEVVKKSNKNQCSKKAFGVRSTHETKQAMNQIMKRTLLEIPKACALPPLIRGICRIENELR